VAKMGQQKHKNTSFFITVNLGKDKEISINGCLKNRYNSVSLRYGNHRWKSDLAAN
jgi:hypothetical protein